MEGHKSFSTPCSLKLDHPGPNPLLRFVTHAGFDPGSSCWNVTFRVLDELDWHRVSCRGSTHRNQNSEIIQRGRCYTRWPEGLDSCAMLTNRSWCGLSADC